MNNIREVARDKDLKIVHIAKAARVSRSHLYDIINGKKNPTLPLAMRIAQAMDTTLDGLFPMFKSGEGRGDDV
jgi:transcriptional regulator with XRE-family HTH domain